MDLLPVQWTTVVILLHCSGPWMVKMNGCVQWKPIYDWQDRPNPGTARSEPTEIYGLQVRIMPPLPVFDDVTLPGVFSSWKDCFQKIILSLTLTQIYSKQALKTFFNSLTVKLFLRTPGLITWYASFNDVTTQFPMMDNSCLINNVVIIKRKEQKLNLLELFFTFQWII